MRCFFFSLCALAIVGSLAEAAEPGWPGWLGPNRDGKSLDTGLLKQWPKEGPKLLWKIDGLGAGYSSPAVTGGKIFVSGDKDGQLMIFALDMDGKQLWTKEFGRSRGGPDGARSSPIIDGGNLYLLNGNGPIGCFDAATGEQKWSRDAKEFGGKPGGWGYAESVLIDKNMAIFKPGGKNCIVALDKTNGQTIWESSGFDAGPEYGSCLLVTFEGQPIILTGSNRGLVAVDATDGKMLWSNDFSAHNTANCPTPAYQDGYVFWANGYGKGGICMKLKMEDGKVAADVAWKTRDMDCQHGGYIIDKGFIYGNHGGGWACLDLKTGKKLWSERAVGKGSLCFADGMLYLFSEKNGKAGLASFSPEGLQLEGTFNVEGTGPSWAHPVVAGGRLYLRYDENLYCFDVKEGSSSAGSSSAAGPSYHASSATATIPADYKGKPAKAAIELPGTIKVTEFDSADGPNISYSYGSSKPRVAKFDKSHKTIKGKPEDVSQSYLGWTKAGEWVKVTVHVKEAGTYVIGGHFAAAGKDGKLSFSFNDITTGPVSIPTTDGYLPGVEVYHVWEQLDNLAEVKLAKGDYVFCCKIEADGGFNLESVTVKKKH